MQYHNQSLPKFLPINTVIRPLQVDERQAKFSLGSQTMLDDSLQNQRLLCGSMVGTEASLRGRMEVQAIRCCC